MKKALSLVLAVVLMLSMATIAFADNTTTLTTTVPDAEYTLNVPKEVPVAFGATSTEIGNVTVTETSGFAAGKNLNVTLTYGDFTCPNVSTTIPMLVNANTKFTLGTAEENYEIASGELLTFLGKSDGTTTQKAIFIRPTNNHYEVQSLYVDILSADWGKALGGDYTATITYTAEIVVE